MILLAGQQYWVVAVSNGIGNQFIWNFNSIGVTGLHASRINGGTFTADTSLQGAFQVLGEPVPEAASYLTAFLGLALMAHRFRRSKGATLVVSYDSDQAIS